MELFKLLGRIIIEGVEKAHNDIASVKKGAETTADTISKSNKTAGESWGTLSSKLQTFSKSMSKIGKTFSDIGKKLTVSLTAPLLLAGGVMVNAASDYEENLNKVSVAFGDSKKVVIDWADTATAKFGLSKNQALEATSLFGDMATSMGLSRAESANMSTSLAGLAGDLASFKNIDIQQAMTALNGVFTGETESLKTLGVVMTEANLQAFALKQGITKKVSAMSQAEKVQLRYAYVMEMTNNAQGDYSNTAGGTANSMRTLQAAVSNLAIAFGQRLLPTITPLIQKATELINKFASLDPTMQQTILKIGAFVAVIGPVASVLGKVFSSVGMVSKGLSFLAGKIAAFGGIKGAFAAIAGAINLPVVAMAALVAAFVVAYNKSETFRNFVNKLKDSLVNGFNAMKEAATTLKNKLTAAWDEISARCAPLISAIKENLIGAFNDLKLAGQGLVDRLGALREKFQPIADILGGALSSAASTASGWFDTLKTKVGDFATGALSWLNDKITAARDAFNAFADFAGRLWDNLDPLVTLIRDNLVNSLQNLSEPISTIKDAFSKIGDTIMNNLLPALRDALMPIWDALMPIWEQLKSALSGVATILGGVFVTALGIASGVINGIVSAISGFAQAVSGVVEIISGAFGLIVGIFTLDGEKIKESVISIKDGIVNVFGGLWDGVVGFVQGFVDGVVGFFQGLWDTLVGHSIVPDIIDGIVNCFSGLWDKVSGLVSGFVDGVVGWFNNLKEKANEIWGNIKTAASEKWESIKTTVVGKVTNLKNTASQGFATLKNKISEYVSGALSAVTDRFNAIKSKVSSAVTAAKSAVSTAFADIKSKISNGVSNALSTVTSKFNSIKEKISNVMNSAKNAVSDAISNIKSKFNFSWSLPKLKLPHPKISGSFSLNPPSVPKFSVEWYKKAYDTPRLLDSPEIFGYNAKTGNFLGGGDGNGAEVVSGANTLMNMIQNAVATQNGALLDVLEKILKAIMAMDDNMGGNLRAALDGAALEINRREFGRIVREVT